MELRRHILPSNYPSQDISLDDSSSRDRQPLADSAGNAQLHTLASIGLNHDSKGFLPRLDRPLYAIPTVPSQPARLPIGNTLELRRQHTRRRRHMRYSRNPIVDSPQYQAYRARQNRDGNADDLKWPAILELAFLDVHRLFPPKHGPRNGFEDSFKNDPCLKALSEGRLPNKSYDQYDNINHLIASSHEPVRPVEFWLLMSSILNFRAGDMNNEAAVAHKFTNIGAQKHRDKLESVLGWRQKFPQLYQLDSIGELNCDIIHMDATLSLLATEPPPGSELVSQSILSILGRQPDHCAWRMVTTLHKPPELYRDPLTDERLENEASSVDVISKTDVETRIKASFPIFHWAHAFSCLVGIQAQYDEHQRSLQSYGTSSEPSSRPAREYVEQVSMYQEVQNAAGPGMPFIRRAVIIWTFHQAREGEGNGTNWRYLDPPPCRRMCMSPSPHPSHHVSSAMNENFNSWADGPLHLQQSMLDPFVQGLATPPHTAGLQPPFGASPYPFSGSSYDIPVENLSFGSTSTVDSENTLVDPDASSNIDHFLSNVNMADYSQDASTWQLPTTENFDADPAWANYTVPSSTPAGGWDEAKNAPWPDLPDTKHMNRTDDASSKHDWTEPGSPSKHMSYIEQNIEQKLLPWIEGHRNGDTETTEPVLQDLITEPLQEVDINAATQTPKPTTEEWIDPDDEFDYAGLVERLK
ncbi:uncharacterized protein LY89DRAFT_658590 [Mollisia scopiformis]|uniref:Uncharacterized protein n=1 Tax=Mollisia scopiformis TaxID=149040 RepID=A0A132BA46_MOLSC|nr:uncharacterized protein LY89DRAFT_658590 [Mollisia scopiformis]KUJ08869.1 hypothetical protein LY89DRAFT_658590 [Mollisia scopiformis]